MAGHFRCGHHTMELVEGAHGWAWLRNGPETSVGHAVWETGPLRDGASGAPIAPVSRWQCGGSGQRRPRRPLHRRQARGACMRHGFPWIR